MDTGIKGRSIHLLPMTPEHLPWLFSWFNDVESRGLWSGTGEVIDAVRFEGEWDRRLSQRIHVLFMVHLLGTDGGQPGPPIGFCYDYDASIIDGHTFICIFMAKQARGSGKGAQVAFHFLSYLWDTFPFRKIYSDVFAFNLPSLGLTSHGGFIEEGRFREHRYLNGEYHDQVRLALYREQWEEVRDRYRKVFSPRPGQRTPDQTIV